jgi:hypothetical protein
MNRWYFLLSGTVVVALCVGTWLAGDALRAQGKAGPAAPAARWEYKIMTHWDLAHLGDPQEKPEPGVTHLAALGKGLDRLGAEGWELGAVDERVYYLKRPRPAR